MKLERPTNTIAKGKTVGSPVMIAVPSLGRPGPIAKDVLSWINDVGVPWIVVVEPREHMYYRPVVPVGHLAASWDNCFISGQLKRIHELAHRFGYKYVLKMDDDMSFADAGRGKQVYRAQVLADHLEILVRFLNENPNVGGIGFARPKAFLNNQKGKGLNFTHKNAVFQGPYLVRTEFLDYTRLAVENATVALPVLDDLVVAINIRDAGLDCLTYAGCMQNYKIGNNPGGMQSFDRSEQERIMFENLKTEYADTKMETHPKLGFLSVVNRYLLPGKTLSITDNLNFG